jgi:glycosyltransferase involved in cell wall biosynthesis
MKVLHVEDRFHPSMGYQINFFARYHHPDYEFFILSSDSSRIWTASEDSLDLFAADKEFEEKYGVSIFRLATSLDRKTRQNLWLKGLIKTIRKIDPDILYVHTLETYSALRIALSSKILRNYRVFFDTHTLLNQFQPGLKSRLFTYFLRKVVSRRIHKNGARVFATVPENRIILEQEYGIQPEHIFYSPIGTDLDMFRYDEDSRREKRSKLDIDTKGIVLLYTGKMNHRKNPHLILDAVSSMEDKIEQDLDIIFVGAADKAYLEKHLRKKFRNDKIRFRIMPAVAVAELYRWYSMADFVVFPDENTLSALDAQACRLPVIMAHDMTNEERLSRGGLTYNKGDLNDLSHKILELIEEEDKRKQLGREGESFIRSTYDYRKIVRNMESDLGLFD